MLLSFFLFFGCKSKTHQREFTLTDSKLKKTKKDQLDSGEDPLFYEKGLNENNRKHQKTQSEWSEWEKKESQLKIKRELEINRGKKMTSIEDLKSLNQIRKRDQKISLKPPFLIGEKMTFSLYWSLFKVGTVTLEVLPFYSSANKNLSENLSGNSNQSSQSLNENRFYHFSMTIRSSLWFFDFENKIDSYVSSRSFKPKLVEIYEREKRRLKEIKLSFYWTRKEVKYSEIKTVRNKGGGNPHKEKIEKIFGIKDSFKKDRLRFPPDIVSSLFYLRLLDLDFINEISPFHVIEKLHTYRVIPSILGQEKVKTSFGVFDTTLLRLDFKKSSNHSKEPKFKNIKLWLTKYDKRYEVRNFIVKLDMKVKGRRLKGTLRELKEGHQRF